MVQKIRRVMLKTGNGVYLTVHNQIINALPACYAIHFFMAEVLFNVMLISYQYGKHINRTDAPACRCDIVNPVDMLPVYEHIRYL
jgi:hypothetical protein